MTPSYTGWKTGRHLGPTFRVPAEGRCEAMTLGAKTDYAAWAQIPHRCNRRARASRDGRVVCNQHNAKPRVQWHDADPANAATTSERWP